MVGRLRGPGGREHRRTERPNRLGGVAIRTGPRCPADPARRRPTRRRSSRLASSPTRTPARHSPGLIRSVLNSLLYFPSRAFLETPADYELPFRDLAIETEDGQRLHGWWVEAEGDSLGHVLLCHGNAGNVGDRALHAKLLAAAGFDVLVFDYRGYGRSSGRPDEQGTYRDARAARAALLREPGVDSSRLVYLGESLGGAVALALALEHPPHALVLQSTFTGIRDMARLHYPVIPAVLVPDAYPSLRLISQLRAPLLVVHGERDEIVPPSHARALFEAAPEPKRLHVLRGAGHNDLVPLAGDAYAELVASWWREVSARR
jgi:uncharacterized protein